MPFAPSPSHQTFFIGGMFTIPKWVVYGMVLPTLLNLLVISKSYLPNLSKSGDTSIFCEDDITNSGVFDSDKKDFPLQQISACSSSM